MTQIAERTVLFADLRGSTALFEILGNAEATSVVTHCVSALTHPVSDAGGRVVKTLGDGLMAVFSSPWEAAQAAAVMHDVLDAIVSRGSERGASPGLRALRLQVALAQGEVVEMAGDCYGDAVNVAARLSDLSGASQIWAASSVLDSAGRDASIRYRPLGPISIRGRAEPCSVYQIEWKVAENSDFLTMQASIDTSLPSSTGDALGGEISLAWLDTVKSFKAFDLPVHIGRDRNVEFIVNDPRVSREHARVDWRNGSVVVVDVSTYGSWIRFSGASSDLLLRREECVLHGTGEIALGAPFSEVSVPTVTFSVS